MAGMTISEFCDNSFELLHYILHLSGGAAFVEIEHHSQIVDHGGEGIGGLCLGGHLARLRCVILQCPIP